MKILSLIFLFILCADLRANHRQEPCQWFAIECPESGYTINLPDFIEDRPYPEQSSTFFRHIYLDRREIIFTIDHFADTPFLLLDEYIKCFTQTWTDEGIELLEEKLLFKGKNRKIPFIRRKWIYPKGTIHQLYFTFTNIGYCLWAYCLPPAGTTQTTIDFENQYWETCLEKIADNLECN